jgi:hypothetical protein
MIMGSAGADQDAAIGRLQKHKKTFWRCARVMDANFYLTSSQPLGKLVAHFRS